MHSRAWSRQRGHEQSERFGFAASFVSGESLGFQPRRGYARLQAIRPADGDRRCPTAALSRSRTPDAPASQGSGDTTGRRWNRTLTRPLSVCMSRERGSESCEVDIERNQIDSPGLLPTFRTADRYARLVREAACFCCRAGHAGDLGRLRSDTGRISRARVRARRVCAGLGTRRLARRIRGLIRLR